VTAAADLRTIAEIAPSIKSGALSPVTLVDQCLARIDTRRELNAFITVAADRARADAREAEREIAAGRWRGPLHGVPISLKDLVHVAGLPTTSASNVPAVHPTADAPIAARLRAAGAIVIGKTNLHEFAFGTTSDETAFGAVHHPLDVSRSAGGSSAGAAVALVEGMCFGAVGTDTGGSIRIPSAACGVVGLKAAFAELPCDGVVPLSTTLDHVGPMARGVEDVALMFDVMHGGANVSLGERPPEEPRLRLAVPERYLCEKLDDDVRAALERVRQHLSSAGHQVTTTDIDHVEWTPDVYLHIVLPEASAFHARTLESPAAAGYSPGVRLRLEMGRYVLAEDYVRAMTLRAVLRRSVERALQSCDALLLPALAIPAPPLGAGSVDVGGSREPVRAMMLRLTQLFNITGHPAIALPAGRSRDGLPVAIQLVARDTRRLLGVAAVVERQIAAGPGSVGGGIG
jgi:aspartyl-tRNA(Asn)/glutamyl-tRNA(Gln) amidotransferase subunit A